MSVIGELQSHLDAFYRLLEEVGSKLDGVFEAITEATREKVILVFGEKMLLITANANDDTIDVSYFPLKIDAKNLNRVSSEQPWESVIGREFGWGWITINQQGYCDGVLLSFDGLIPEIMLYVVASSIKVLSIVKKSK